ncbi:hypothetical protein PM082_000903 [Marasmius tenuissimus]|nr:hypothetical protein PM082_000903 [Marasmius tenuissimus]
MLSSSSIIHQRCCIGTSRAPAGYWENMAHVHGVDSNERELQVDQEQVRLSYTDIYDPLNETSLRNEIVISGCEMIRRRRGVYCEHSPLRKNCVMGGARIMNLSRDNKTKP